MSIKKGLIIGVIAGAGVFSPNVQAQITVQPNNTQGFTLTRTKTIHPDPPLVMQNMMITPYGVHGVTDLSFL